MHAAISLSYKILQIQTKHAHDDLPLLSVRQSTVCSLATDSRTATTIDTRKTNRWKVKCLSNIAESEHNVGTTWPITIVLQFTILYKERTSYSSKAQQNCDKNFSISPPIVTFISTNCRSLSLCASHTNVA